MLKLLKLQTFITLKVYQCYLNYFQSLLITTFLLLFL